MNRSIPKSRQWVFLLLTVMLLSDCTSLQSIVDAVVEATSPPNLSWASRRDLSHDSFSTWFDEYRDRGWIIKDVDAYPDGNSLKYSMIWEENPDGHGWAEWRNLTGESYQEKWEQYRDQGYLSTDVEGYMSGNQMRYAGIWEENTQNLAWSSRRGLTASEYGTYFEEKSDDGFRLIDMEAYETNSGIRYACIWHENKTNIEWAQYRDMTRTSYQQRIDQFSADGYRVIDFESYQVNGNQRYAAIWEKNLFDHATAVRTDRTEIEYANYWRLYRDMGYRLIDFERYETSNGTRYAGVWTENSDRFRWNKKGTIDNLVDTYRSSNGIPGISCAIIEDGKLVYMRGFGLADLADNKEAHGKSVYLSASISKAIGGTLAGKLENEGQLVDGTTVNLNLGLPTTNYLDIPGSSHTHTVRQLMSHTGCIWHYTGPTPSGHYTNAQDAVEDMWNNPPLSNCTIGSSWNYSTHAFTFVGAVLEDVTGRSIARLIEEEIADRYNFNSMKVQYRNTSLPSNYERVAPYDSNNNEVSYGDNSWKVLGGGIEVDAVDLAWFGQKVLSAQIVNANTRDNRLWAPVNGNTNNGYAWSLGADSNGNNFAEHGGSWTGARTHLRVYRDTGADLVVVVMTNKTGHSPSTLVSSIGDELLN